MSDEREIVLKIKVRNSGDVVVRLSDHASVATKASLCAEALAVLATGAYAVATRARWTLPFEFFMVAMFYATMAWAWRRAAHDLAVGVLAMARAHESVVSADAVVAKRYADAMDAKDVS